MMRSGMFVLVMLAMASLVSGSGAALAATAPPKAPEAVKSAAMAPSATAAVENEAQETKAIREGESTAAARERAEGETTVDRVVRGDVTAVVLPARTLVVQAMLGGQSATIGVEVPPSTKISAGDSHKTLADIKAGDSVWMRYDRLRTKLVADQIRIEKSAAPSAKSEAAGMKS
jgi:Cu/Ag efflux protein CusF